jgi:hypothetical protein
MARPTPTRPRSKKPLKKSQMLPAKRLTKLLHVPLAAAPPVAALLAAALLAAAPPKAAALRVAAAPPKRSCRASSVHNPADGSILLPSAVLYPPQGR